MLHTLYLTNKTERYSYKSGCVIRVVNRLMVHSVTIAIAASNNFVPLLKSFIANVQKYKACLKVKFKCVYITMDSLVISPFSCDFIKI